MAIKLRHRVLQRIGGFLDREGVGDNPKAILLIFQTRLTVGDHRVEQILFRLVEETKVGAPGHDVADHVDSGLRRLSCHR